MKRAVRLSGYRPPEAWEISPLLRGKPFGGFTSIVDVGSFNCEDYTIPGFKAGYTVWTFELDPRNRARCKGELQKQGIPFTEVQVNCNGTFSRPPIQRPHVYLVEAGASDTAKCVRIEGEHQMSFVTPGDGIFPVVRVADIVPKSESVYLIKSDTQGHESAVLRGAEQLLDTVYAVAIEYWPRGAQLNGLDAVDSIQMLHAHGFTCYDTAFHDYNVVSRPSELQAFTQWLLGQGQTVDAIGSWDDLLCFRE